MSAGGEGSATSSRAVSFNDEQMSVLSNVMTAATPRKLEGEEVKTILQ